LPAAAAVVTWTIARLLLGQGSGSGPGVLPAPPARVVDGHSAARPSRGVKSAAGSVAPARGARRRHREPPPGGLRAGDGGARRFSCRRSGERGSGESWTAVAKDEKGDTLSFLGARGCRDLTGAVGRWPTNVAAG